MAKVKLRRHFRLNRTVLVMKQPQRRSPRDRADSSCRPAKWAGSRSQRGQAISQAGRRACGVISSVRLAGAGPACPEMMAVSAGPEPIRDRDANPRCDPAGHLLRNPPSREGVGREGREARCVHQPCDPKAIRHAATGWLRKSSAGAKLAS